MATLLKKCGLTHESTDFINRWLDATKSNLLFARGIILVEGIAEAMLLPVFAKSILKEYNLKREEKNKLPVLLEDCGVSVINMNGIYFEHFMQLFCDVRNGNSINIPIKCAGVTDNDPESDKYPSPSKPEKGNNPALGLIPNINKSVWSRLYHCDFKTFEYDLALEKSNLSIMSTALIQIIEKDGSIKTTLERFANNNWDNEEETKKVEAAKYFFDHIKYKGLYAQVLAQHLEVNHVELTLPVYIKKAVIWACGGVENDTG